MMDVAGVSLDETDRDILRHPLVGGVILFARNFASGAQLSALTKEIHALKSPRLILAVDHEGGRIQRFRAGFTELPAAHAIGMLFDENPTEGLALARHCGWIMAAELLTHGIDFSFAPVLDLYHPRSSVINDRAFHSDPDTVARLAAALIDGMHGAGMAAVGKHFPGHGTVLADSHSELPIDERSYYDIAAHDLVPFRRLASQLQGIMPAHVLFPKVDTQPAGYSAVWIRQVLRVELGFQGVVFSDDLSMAGAAALGGIATRAQTAVAAGCDMILHCNDRPGVEAILSRANLEIEPVAQVRLMRMHGKMSGEDVDYLRRDGRWRAASEAIKGLHDTPELDLGDDLPA
jgi:beta-N-acetylhexosaminidase